MQNFPWWTEKQRRLADDAREFVDRMMPLATECCWKRRFPKEILREIGRKGWFGAMIPEQYGGHLEEWGVTGACIINEQVGRAGEVSGPFTSTMIGSIHQILHFGTEEQKERWLPPLAKGERLGAITITEPFAGSDASGIRTKARLEGDHYVLNGKKRFIGHSGVAETYMAYVKTSDRPEDKAKHRHLTALIVEKGTPGFHVEKVVDLVGFPGNYIGYLNFENASVPVANRLAGEGDGWRVMTSGLNAERVVSGAQWLGYMWESIRYAVYHMQRRLQFGQPTIDISANQLKIAEMLSRLVLARVITFYTAYLIDHGQEPPLESALVKLFNADSAMAVAVEAIQCMGGDGLTKYYPVERIMRDAKIAQIVAGTQEINKLVIFRQAMALLEDDLKVPYFKVHEELKVPMPTNEDPPREHGREGILRILAENYRVHPGLHLGRKELLARLEMTEKEMDKGLLALEEEGLVDLYRDKRGVIALAKASYEGLARVHPPEYYGYIPDWVDADDMF